jgi:hypothetical protein
MQGPAAACAEVEGERNVAESVVAGAAEEAAPSALPTRSAVARAGVVLVEVKGRRCASPPWL